MSDDWKEQKKRQKAIFTAQQNLPYEVKVRRAELRAREFIQELDRRGMNAHVSVGGLDSIVLLMFLRSRGINVPAVSVSSLEDKSIIIATRKTKDRNLTRVWFSSDQQEDCRTN